MPNRLADATSPYLLQHQDNPVDWWPWGEAALAAARAEDKPILLSIGYAACHWCHVMAHESFEDDSIAALMNQHFVSIKVDREERPDLDQIYQHALALLGQQGGWPLTMFLTPDGEPFWGGTYFPPQSRYGRPGLPEVLTTVDRIWREERPKIAGNTQALRQALGRLAAPTGGAPVDQDFAVQIARRVVQSFDTFQGGLAGAPKFPQAPMLDLLWRQALRTGDPGLRQAVLLTLQRICQGGIFDHLGGGFARYAVDAMWLVPHFEKMLYDNAQLLGLLADAWADTHEPLFAARADATVGWLEREMLVGDAFASSLDADSEGEEGRYYVWESAEIDRRLGPAAAAFRLAYGVTDIGNWEGRNVLNRLHQPGLSPPDEEAALRQSAAVLLQARATRPAPARDDKVLADWNGLVIAALARAAVILDRPPWLERARAAFDFVCRNMDVGGRLSHSWRNGQRMGIAFLDDYVQMASAAISLFERTGDHAYLERAERWIAELERHHLDRQGGGFFLSADDAVDVPVRTKTAADGPVPSGNGALVSVLARLHALSGHEPYRARAERQLEVFAGEVKANPVAHMALLSGLMLLEHPISVVIAGTPESSSYRALHHAALRTPVPTTIVYPLDPARDLPEHHPAAGKTASDAPTQAFVCPGQTCLPPVADPVALTALLREQLG